MRREVWLALILLTACPEGATKSPNSGVSQSVFLSMQARLRSEFSQAAYKEAFKRHALKEGQPFARLQIPTLGVNLIVIEGIAGDALQAGAGHYPNSSYPGSGYPDELGNVCIAGHRTNFSAPFLKLDTLKRGDTALLQTPSGTYRYRLALAFEGHANPWVTSAHDFRPVAHTDEAVLTLTTADPPHTSKNRLIARFELVR